MSAEAEHKLEMGRTLIGPNLPGLTTYQKTLEVDSLTSESEPRIEAARSRRFVH